MEGIKLWIKSLTGFIFICAVIEALVPEAPAKKTLRMLLGVIMSILIISPLAGISLEGEGIFDGVEEYINYEDTAREMQELTDMQSRRLYEQSVGRTVKSIVGEDVRSEVILTEECEIEKIIIHKNVPGKKADLAAALGVLPSKIQMTE